MEKKKKKKTAIQNKSNKQNSNDELTPHYQNFIESSTNSSRTIETFNNKIHDNQPSMQSPSTTLTRDPNNTSSYKTNHSPIVSPKLQPIINNTSRLNAYIHNNKSKRTPKSKTLSPAKLHVHTTKQDSLFTFGFRVKVPTPSHHTPALPIDNTMQLIIH